MSWLFLLPLPLLYIYRENLKRYAFEYLLKINLAPSSFTVDSNICSIKYSHNGKEYNLYLPYNKSLIAKTLGSEVLLHRNEDIINITQSPGIPYTYSAKDLKADYISIKKNGSSKILASDEIPFNL